MKLIGGYTEEMRKSIDNVNKTRSKRRDQIIADLTMDERKKVLEQFHPDYNPKYKRDISWGSNKGDNVPNEVATILESYPTIDPNIIDLNQIDYDVGVLIIGAGGAGTSAALWTKYSGVPKKDILMVTKLRFGDCNSVMAQGGIQAADRSEDDPHIHYLDAIGGGHFENKPALVKALTGDAPKIIKWHKELGVNYDCEDDGNFVEVPGGGTSRNRMHCAKDYTGMEIFRTLKDEAINQGIPYLEFSPAVELLTDESGRVTGAILYNIETRRYYIVRARSAVIMSTGGFGRLHVGGFATTNHYGATMDGVVMAYRAGAKLRDLDSTQFHPTGAAYPEQIVGLLVTEKVRSLGGQVLGKDGEQICYPLEPRDVEAASLIKVCTSSNNYIETPTGMRGIWLDSPLIEEVKGKGTIQQNLSAMYRMFKRFDIDITEDPILVYPTLHYQNGGVEIDENCYTSVNGLLVAGETSGGVHGKNRLMGNSLLEINVFGRRAGITAAKEYKKNTKPGKLTLDHVHNTVKALDALKIKSKKYAPILLPEYRSEIVKDRLVQLYEQLS